VGLVVRVAALYVDPIRGPYPRIPGVDVLGWAGPRQGSFWDRDARDYGGPDPIVAHPPCGPWGKWRRRYKGGEGDADCGPRAIEQARASGGVVEHPAFSTLWDACDLPRPRAGFDEFGGWTLSVSQVDWGHPCPKPTWLYIVGTDTIPPIPVNLDGPTHCMVRLRRNTHDRPELPKRDRHLTPPAFARWLVSLARRCVS